MNNYLKKGSDTDNAQDINTNFENYNNIVEEFFKECELVSKEDEHKLVIDEQFNVEE